ncbi:hypothetical protein CRE_17345 [Caenorhabditis remanei]|uniref:Uncharacterized protein n=1 Tax=Caenorhabditis remanei TaxID=31234 RepID=E3MS08_CAERE|nr:hypothetical protein CRE_17345 [Caenorhabditis remanei]
MPSKKLLSYDLLTIVFNLNDPRHLLKLLKNSLIEIRNNEKEEEASVDQIKELLKMEKWMNLKRTSLETKIEDSMIQRLSGFGASFLFFILLSWIIKYLIYTGQSLSLASRLLLRAGGILLSFIFLALIGLNYQKWRNPGLRGKRLAKKIIVDIRLREDDDEKDEKILLEYQRNLEKEEVFEPLMMFELRNRHVALINSFIDTINLLKQEAKVWRDRERVPV